MIQLTHQERKVVLFISLLFVIGIGLVVFKKMTGCRCCLFDSHSQKISDRVYDINQVTREELIALPYVGEARADAIIAYRTTQGPIKDIAALKNIKGISSKNFDVLKKYLCVRVK